MPSIDSYELAYIVSAFTFQTVLIIHFALRRWRFNIAMRYGRIIYALGIPAAIVSMYILLGGKTWSFWLSGFLYLIWATFGYFVEYIKKIQWRDPIYWPVFGPYIFLYLATVMFYWFPLAIIRKPFWYLYAILFLASTILNVASHQGSTNSDS